MLILLFFSLGIAEVKNAKFKLGDLPWIIQIVVEQVLSDCKR